VARQQYAWLNALNRADVDIIAALLADDFMRPAPQSSPFIGRTDLLHYHRSHLVPLRRKLYGSSAIAQGEGVTRDSRRTIVSRLLFTEVVGWRAGRWQAVSTQENPVSGH
jgi:hypothetical protein